MNKSDYFNGIHGLLKPDVKLEFEKWQLQEIYKCKHDIAYFLDTYVKITHQEYGLIPFKLYDFQKDFIDCIDKNNRVLGLLARQSGKTSSLVGYILHYIIFNTEKNVGITANKASTSRKILKDVRLMFKNVPIWLKPSVEIWNKGDIRLSNGCCVLTDATSSDSFTGNSLSLCVIDEISKIDANLFDDFIKSVLPTVSSSKSAKIIGFSTPKGLNHWFRWWSEALQGLNGYVPFTVSWDSVPGRDEKFKQKIIKEQGISYWKQEFECEFLGSSDSLISMTKLQSMPHKKPIATQYDGRFLIYEYPEKEINYYLICDYGEGLQQDYSTIQIFKKVENKFIQVATYKDNTSKPREFANIKFLIGNYYNYGLIVGESNLGKESLNELFEELEYDGDVFFDVEEKDKIGIRTTKKTKKLGCTYAKSMIENDVIQIVDFDTINELSTFVKRGNSYEADKNCHDDLVIPIVLFAYLTNHELFIDWYIDNYEMRSNDAEINKEDILPAFFQNNGEEIDDGFVELT